MSNLSQLITVCLFLGAGRVMGAEESSSFQKLFTIAITGATAYSIYTTHMTQKNLRKLSDNVAQLSINNEVPSRNGGHHGIVGDKPREDGTQGEVLASIVEKVNQVVADLGHVATITTSMYKAIENMSSQSKAQSQDFAEKHSQLIHGQNMLYKKFQAIHLGSGNIIPSMQRSQTTKFLTQ